ncbi:hypothetical protein P4V33_23855, partial [Brevibacillus borstelensis]|nr:hypothetical protein [Brevibacillus borstelensis]
FYATLMKSHKASEGKNNLVSFIESKKSEISYLYVEEFNTSLSKEVIQPPPVFESLNDFFKEDVLKKLTPTTEMSVGVVN